MKIIQFPHPTLRHKSRIIRRFDAQLRDDVKRMFELMYEARGVGLAANQVDLPLRLFVINLAADPNEGEEMVFINPVISRPKGSDEQEEGCLSLPGVYGGVIRPKTVHIQAYDLSGQTIEIDAEGMMARVAQHENDHLDGVMFTDRMSSTGQMAIAESLEEFETVFNSQRETGGIPPDDEILARLRMLEQRYCE